MKLIDEGNTIPFIARYRKEATGSLDDGQLRRLHERLTVSYTHLADDVAAVLAEQVVEFFYGIRIFHDDADQCDA